MHIRTITSYSNTHHASPFHAVKFYPNPCYHIFPEIKHYKDLKGKNWALSKCCYSATRVYLPVMSMLFSLASIFYYVQHKKCIISRVLNNKHKNFSDLTLSPILSTINQQMHLHITVEMEKGSWFYFLGMVTGGYHCFFFFHDMYLSFRMLKM